MIDLDRAVSLLRDAQDIEILSHHFPDGDTLGCAAALCHALHLLGKRARCTCADPVSEKYSFLFEEIEKQEFPAKFVVSVDVADIKLLGAGSSDCTGDLYRNHNGYWLLPLYQCNGSHA
ncbi:MAG: hypothetical protein E7L17_12645 [Clostridium sp.]|uniref:DHH family phosphoesterase n=1 Tax=Clostridium sp. TaxID=1506 RepID=UPI0029089A13|nr:hypothetical protein [Clostridium sp.]MDU7338952.1 hypothetical protein [Clostridium sp.]